MNHFGTMIFPAVRRCSRLFAVLIGLLLVGTASGATLAELKTQLATAEQQFDSVYAAKDAMVYYTNNYAVKMAAMQQAFDDLRDLEDRLRTLLRNNLIKSTLVLAYNTYEVADKTINIGIEGVEALLHGGFIHTVTETSLAAFEEFLPDMQKDKMGCGVEELTTAYTVNIRGLRAATLAYLPQIKKVQTILRMSLEDVKAAALKDDKVDLAETGCIYRKYQMLLDAIDQAEIGDNGLSALMTKMRQTEEAYIAQLPQVEAERIRLGTLCTDLRNQISALHASVQSAVSSQTVTNYYEISPPITVQDLNMTWDSSTETYTAYLLRRKHLVEAYVAQEFSSLKGQSATLSAAIDQKISAFATQYGQYFGLFAPHYFWVSNPMNVALSLGNSRETMDSATLGSVLSMVRNHKLVKDAEDGLIAAAGAGGSLLVSAQADLQALLDIFAQLKTVDENVSALISIAQNEEYAIAQPGVVTEPVNLPANMEAYRNVAGSKGYWSLCNFMGVLQDQPSQVTTALATLHARRLNYEAAMDGTAGTNGPQSFYALEWAEVNGFQDALANCEQARAQLIACAGEYSNLIGQNRFLSQCPTDQQSYGMGTYSNGTNGNGNAIQYYYQSYYFQQAVSRALAATNGYAGADPIWFAYSGVVNRYRDINRRYNEAFVKYSQYYSQLNHYLGNTSEFSWNSTLPAAADLSQAAAADSYLTVAAPDVDSLTRRFQAVGGINGYELGGMATLPDTEDDITTLPVYQVYQFKKKIAVNGPQWLSLWPVDFDAIYGQCTNELKAIRTNINYDEYLGWSKAQNELGALNTQYDVVNPAPSISVLPQPSLMVSNGGRGTFTISATCPNPITYQWYWGALNDFSNPIPFANSAGYTTPSITYGQIFYCFPKLSSRSHTPYVTAGPFSVMIDPAALVGPGGTGGGGPGGGGPGGGGPGGGGASNNVTQPFNTLSNWAVNCNLPANQRGANDDPAHIGLPNRLAYALGINPLNFDPKQLPKTTLAPDRMEMSFTRPFDTIGCLYSIQSSCDLSQWNSESPSKISVSASNETWSASIPRTNSMMFIRLNVGP